MIFWTTWQPVKLCPVEYAAIFWSHVKTHVSGYLFVTHYKGCSQTLISIYIQTKGVRFHRAQDSTLCCFNGIPLNSHTSAQLERRLLPLIAERGANLLLEIMRRSVPAYAHSVRGDATPSLTSLSSSIALLAFGANAQTPRATLEGIAFRSFEILTWQNRPDPCALTLSKALWGQDKLWFWDFRLSLSELWTDDNWLCTVASYQYFVRLSVLSLYDGIPLEIRERF